MNETLYLTRRRKTYFFRRRVPGFSTGFRPVMVSLGTTDHRSALKSCATLTAHMDRMLDHDLHMTLPEADVAAFFKAELTRVLRNLRVARTVAHVDGSMTTHKADQYVLKTTVLSGLAEDGLSKEMSSTRLEAINQALRDEAEFLHRKTYAQYMSADFNEAIQLRASEVLGRSGSYG